MKTKMINKFLLLLATAAFTVAISGVSAFAGTAAVLNDEAAASILDLDFSTADIKDSQSFDQNYTLTVTNAYTDVTKVKIEWSLQDITAVREDAKVWDPDTLSWVNDDENDAITPGEAASTFTITNFSSVKVEAKVEFEAESGFTPSVAYTGVDETSHKTTINTVVKDDKEVDTEISHSKAITVKVTPAKADFANGNAADAKYGTYTVTLGKVLKSTTLTVAQSGGGWAVSSITVNGKNVSVTKTRDSDGYVAVKEGDSIVVNFSEARACYAFAYTTESASAEAPSNVALATENNPVTTLSFTVPALSDGVIGLSLCIYPKAS